MKRIAPDAGPRDDPEPETTEAMTKAEQDRLLQMSVYGLSEDDFPDETVWVPDSDDEA